MRRGSRQEVPSICCLSRALRPRRSLRRARLPPRLPGVSPHRCHVMGERRVTNWRRRGEFFWQLRLDVSSGGLLCPAAPPPLRPRRSLRHTRLPQRPPGLSPHRRHVVGEWRWTNRRRRVGGGCGRCDRPSEAGIARCGRNCAMLSQLSHLSK